jgi:hypothetical protein
MALPNISHFRMTPPIRKFSDHSLSEGCDLERISGKPGRGWTWYGRLGVTQKPSARFQIEWTEALLRVGQSSVQSHLFRPANQHTSQILHVQAQLLYIIELREKLTKK